MRFDGGEEPGERGVTAVYETLKKILVDTLKVEPEQITPDATKDDLDLDSLAFVELSMVLGKEHGLHISDDELFDMETVGDIVALMEERAGDRP
ncbi:acyl carrier protein [Actinosynnema sp. NPDC023794]